MPGRSRRHFLESSVALAGAGLLVGCGWLPSLPEQARIRHIGFLSAGDSRSHLWHEAFVQGLREHGYIEGQNIAIAWRTAAGRVEQLPNLAAELVRLGVEVIVARAATGVPAAREATATIPIVMTPMADPVGLGFVNSFARPGGNITGLASFHVDLIRKARFNGT